MSLPKGIHVFYASAMKPPAGSHRTKGVNLYHLHFDGAAAVLNEQVRIWPDIDVGRGVSAIQNGDAILIQCTMSNEKMRRVRYSVVNGKSSFDDMGDVQDVSTHDRSSAVFDPPNAYTVYYKKKDGGTLAQWPQGQRLFPEVKLDFGPAATKLGNTTYIACNQNEKVLAMRASPQRSVISDFVPGTTLQNSPTLVTLPLDDSVMLLHRSRTTIWDSKQHGLFSNVFVASTQDWKGDTFVSEFPEKPSVQRPTWLNNSPGPCVYGERVYCFMQGTDGNLWCQLYMGDRWTIDNVKILVNDLPVSSIWYGPCAVAV